MMKATLFVLWITSAVFLTLAAGKTLESEDEPLLRTKRDTWEEKDPWADLEESGEDGKAATPAKSPVQSVESNGNSADVSKVPDSPATGASDSKPSQTKPQPELVKPPAPAQPILDIQTNQHVKKPADTIHSPVVVNIHVDHHVHPNTEEGSSEDENKDEEDDYSDEDEDYDEEDYEDDSEEKDYDDEDYSEEEEDYEDEDSSEEEDDYDDEDYDDEDYEYDEESSEEEDDYDDEDYSDEDEDEDDEDYSDEDYDDYEESEEESGEDSDEDYDDDDADLWEDEDDKSSEEESEEEDDTVKGIKYHKQKAAQARAELKNFKIKLRRQWSPTMLAIMYSLLITAAILLVSGIFVSFYKERLSRWLIRRKNGYHKVPPSGDEGRTLLTGEKGEMV